MSLDCLVPSLCLPDGGDMKILWQLCLHNTNSTIHFPIYLSMHSFKKYFNNCFWLAFYFAFVCTFTLFQRVSHRCCLSYHVCLWVSVFRYFVISIWYLCCMFWLWFFQTNIFLSNALVKSSTTKPAVPVHFIV